jgi:hypothetical protein
MLGLMKQHPTQRPALANPNMPQQQQPNALYSK